MPMRLLRPFERLRLVPVVLLLVAASLGVTRTATAAPILVADAPGQVFASLVFTTSPVPDAADIRLLPGLTVAAAHVVDGTTHAVLGSPFVTDFGLPFPNIVLLATPDFVQASALLFDFSGASLAPSGVLTVPGAGFPLTAMTDTGLLALAGGFTANFDFFDVFKAGDATVVQFALQSARVPEPASLSLIALGLAGGAARRWRRRSNAAA